MRVPIPGGKLVTEHLAAVPQANGYDYWIVVHGFETNEFYAFALTQNGLSATPVISTVGSVFTGATTAQTGLIRFSPNGRQLAVTKMLGGLELFDFDPATGVVSNGASLLAPARITDILTARTVGVEFSADGSVLYTHEGPNILRFDLQAGSPEKIIASRYSMGRSPRPVGDFLRGPDNRIYIAVYDDSGLSVIERANSLVASSFVFRGSALIPTSIPIVNPTPCRSGLCPTTG
ncbi:hypothetical protein [Hymenobacter cellulosilyticus]|uniref:Uncharacterized protein n=1 Tax=Hymenobacter cellulosilyticus TaxID=2932248 RepID=A0A8T9PYE6_9BACT|nr:hypothetical protein [Hymenobacter cellulosilyticus]UOQ70087.1 hypothetical protein MUN79_15040 [Hymenobacter cellulosilyticus]